MTSLTKKTLFGQIVIGPPGSGKTTYCTTMAQYLRQLNRKVAVVNLGKISIFNQPEALNY